MSRSIEMILEEVIFRGNGRTNEMYRGQNYRGGYRRHYQNENYERGRSRSRERQYPENTEGMTVSVVDLDQVHELVQIETGSDAINVENTITLVKTV